MPPAETRCFENGQEPLLERLLLLCCSTLSLHVLLACTITSDVLPSTMFVDDFVCGLNEEATTELHHHTRHFREGPWSESSDVTTIECGVDCSIVIPLIHVVVGLRR